MLKKIASVLFVLLFTLGVVLAGNLFYAGEGKMSREANTEGSDKRTGVEENDTASLNMKDLFIKLPAKYRWNLNFFVRKAMMSVGDEIKEICVRLETAGEEKEDVELNTPWAEAYYEFLRKN